MNVLVIGSGGREHAICFKILQSPMLKKLYTLPSNSSFSIFSKNLSIDMLDFETISRFVKENSVDLVVVGPELALSKGIADRLRAKNIKVFGPGLKGAILESSKQIAKEFMYRNYIPTADFKIFYDFGYAVEYIKKNEKYPLVVKADGLCAGKGVRICRDYDETYTALDDFMNKGIFGSSGMKVVIEDYLEGKEASLLCFVDGKRYLMLPIAKDYKRLLDKNEGPNTGGMGSISPLDLDDATLKRIDEEIVWRFMDAIIRERIDYRGVIYFGLMITNDGPKVLEFNVRFGDPETQSILPLLDDDLLEIMNEVAEGSIKRHSIRIKNMKSVCVVISSKSYPFASSSGKEIKGLDKIDKDVFVFYAGTRYEDSKYYTNGGRILNIVGLDKNFKLAREKVYKNVEKISFDDIYFRKDIAEEESFESV